jgi:hypothetical protein
VTWNLHPSSVLTICSFIDTHRFSREDTVMRHRARRSSLRTTAARMETASIAETSVAVMIAMFLSWLITSA